MERVTVWVYTAACKSRVRVLRSVAWDQESGGLDSTLYPTALSFSMVVYHKTSGLKFLICRDDTVLISKKSDLRAKKYLRNTSSTTHTI